MLILPDALASMAPYRQFLLYKIQPGKREGKNDKIPVSPSGEPVDAHNPSSWMSVDEAISISNASGLGVGFAFTKADPFWFLDIDNCLQDNGMWSPIAIQLAEAFTGAAIEVSSSGKGLHIFGSGECPPHSCRNSELGLEFYTSGRFVALTGTSAVGNVATQHPHAINWLVSTYFPFKSSGGEPEEWRDTPVEAWVGPEDDDILLDRAFRSRSAGATFGDKASFADLWEANVAVLSKAYPDPEREYDASSADRALAQHLAFWTGNNHERIQRIMLRSFLVREKWEREDYLPRTIAGACASQKEWCVDKQALQTVPPPASELVRPTITNGNAFLGIPEQLNLFAGCVYVTELHKIYIPGGALLKPEQFKVTYGGYTFAMDNANERSVRNAWEAFTENQNYRPPQADTTCFRPRLPPGAIINDGGKTRVNLWQPVDVPRKHGDPTPFLNHLAKVLPDARDQTILLSYMAACVQYKGCKFQWCPIIQGVEGNGKTLFTQCVAEALGRRYVHMPRADLIDGKFNSWLTNRLFIGVEDIYVTDQKAHVLEVLKPMITSNEASVEQKGVDQVMADVCCNFMLNSNHEDALKAQDPRRLAMFYSAQQKKSDLARDGMDGDYFPRLYRWLRAEGFAVVSELLHTYQIPQEFNPDLEMGLAHRAPETSSSAHFKTVSLGRVEQELIEVVGQSLPGFAGGWLSSIALDRLLERIGASRSMSQQKRHKMLTSLGYVVHPGLPEGRTKSIVLPDNSRPKLYVKADSHWMSLTDADRISEAYSKCQN